MNTKTISLILLAIATSSTHLPLYSMEESPILATRAPLNRTARYILNQVESNLEKFQKDALSFVEKALQQQTPFEKSIGCNLFIENRIQELQQMPEHITSLMKKLSTYTFKILERTEPSTESTAKQQRLYNSLKGLLEDRLKIKKPLNPEQQKLFNHFKRINAFFSFAKLIQDYLKNPSEGSDQSQGLPSIVEMLTGQKLNKIQRLIDNLTNLAKDTLENEVQQQTLATSSSQPSMILPESLENMFFREQLELINNILTSSAEHKFKASTNGTNAFAKTFINFLINLEKLDK